VLVLRRLFCFFETPLRYVNHRLILS
jgi:hypothetical protein